LADIAVSSYLAPNNNGAGGRVEHVGKRRSERDVQRVERMVFVDRLSPWCRRVPTAYRQCTIFLVKIGATC
jgi:hypothetical protein